jgi:membrane-associated protease RseP (regulator of RpoE activity)
MNYVELSTVIIFLVILGIFLLSKRRKLTIQKIIFPLFYLIMFKTSIGLNFMEKYGKKYRDFIVFLGNCFVGFAVLGMVLIFILLFYTIVKSLFIPADIPPVTPVLPYVPIPGLGTIGFWHWIIAIFVLATFHEFAHGIVAIANKVKIKSSGPAFFAVLVPIIPAAFVEPDEKNFQKKSDIIKYSVYSAGPVANIILGLFLMIIVVNFIMVPIQMHYTEPQGLEVSSQLDPDAPAYGMFEEPTLITFVNGKPVVERQDFLRELQCLTPGETVTLANNENQYEITTKDKDGKASLGILFTEKREWTTGGDGKIYSWILDLIRWTALLNIFVGLANLLPLGPIDGGLILKTLLERLCKNRKKAMKWWAIISIFTLLLLIVGLGMYFLSL